MLLVSGGSGLDICESFGISAPVVLDSSEDAAPTGGGRQFLRRFSNRSLSGFLTGGGDDDWSVGINKSNRSSRSTKSTRSTRSTRSRKSSTRSIQTANTTSTTSRRQREASYSRGRSVGREKSSSGRRLFSPAAPVEDEVSSYHTETRGGASEGGRKKSLLKRLFRGSSSRRGTPAGGAGKGPTPRSHMPRTLVLGSSRHKQNYNLSMANHSNSASMTTTPRGTGASTATTPASGGGGTPGQPGTSSQKPTQDKLLSASESWEDKEEELHQFHRTCRDAQALNLRRTQETLQSVPWILQEPVDAIGNRPLHVLCSHKPSLQAVQLFVALADCTPPPQVIANHQGWLPLHSACAHRASLDVVEFLIDKTEAASNSGMTTTNNTLSIVEESSSRTNRNAFLYLLTHVNRNTLLHLECDVKPEWPKEDDDDDDKSTRSAVQAPVMEEETAEEEDVASSLEVVRLLVELAPELAQQCNAQGILPIHLACQAHATGCVQFLTTKFPALLTEADGQGQTPQHFLQDPLGYDTLQVEQPTTPTPATSSPKDISSENDVSNKDSAVPPNQVPEEPTHQSDPIVPLDKNDDKDNNNNKEPSLVATTTMTVPVPEPSRQLTQKKAVVFPPPGIPQLDETNGVIAVEPTVLNSVLEKLDFVGFPVALTTSQDTSTTTTSCRSIARSIAHAWKQAAPHRDVLPLNASSAETLLHDYNTVVQECWTSTTTTFVPRTELCSSTTNNHKTTNASDHVLAVLEALPPTPHEWLVVLEQWSTEAVVAEWFCSAQSEWRNSRVCFLFVVESPESLALLSHGLGGVWVVST